MPYRNSFPGTITSGSLVGSVDNNTLPGGKIGRARATTNSAHSGTPVLVASIALNVGSGREITIWGTGMLQTNDDNHNVTILITEDGVYIQQQDITITKGNHNESYCIFVSRQPTMPSPTYALYVAQNGGGGTAPYTVMRVASAAAPSEIIVYDDGPAL